jgi:hypothetical protein
MRRSHGEADRLDERWAEAQAGGHHSPCLCGTVVDCDKGRMAFRFEYCGAMDMNCAFDGSAAQKDAFIHGTNSCIMQCMAFPGFIEAINPNDCAPPSRP